MTASHHKTEALQRKTDIPYLADMEYLRRISRQGLNISSHWFLLFLYYPAMDKRKILNSPLERGRGVFLFEL